MHNSARTHVSGCTAVAIEKSPVEQLLLFTVDRAHWKELYATDVVQNGISVPPS